MLSVFGRGLAVHSFRSIRYGLLLVPLIAFASEANDTPADKTGVPPPIVKAVPLEVPDPYKINMLIRTTLIALNQANQTGNYSVLRDLGTPQFQAMNTDARLAEIFSDLRKRNLDLSPVLFFNPTLARNPAVQDNGILRMTGFLDTKPQRVLFDMGFQWVDGDWRLAAIVVDIKAPKAEPGRQSESPGEKAHPDATSNTKGGHAHAPKPRPARAQDKARGKHSD
jgi:hypothetical protein